MGEEVQAKGIENIFNKIKAENFPNLGKQVVIETRPEKNLCGILQLKH
jgi:hypothetical protein